MLLMTMFILQGGQADFLISLVPFALIFVFFYLLIFRPMRKRQKEHEALLSNLENGARVVTSGGIYGTVAGLKEKTLLLKVADNVKIEVAKSDIAGLQSNPPEEK